MMNGYVGVADNDWVAFLSRQPEIDEVNLWQPGGSGHFRELQPGEPFLFRLHPLEHYIVGGGFFVHRTILPVSVAWAAFGPKNGARSLQEMRRLIQKRRLYVSPLEDYKIECIALAQPFFFREKDWLRIPPHPGLNIVAGKTFDLREGDGKWLWINVALRLAAMGHLAEEILRISELGRQYDEILSCLRLGPGSFRVIITDAYASRCAITQEKTLPVLEAAHIKPWSENGPHSIENGILLRSDMHRLFDAGYVTVTADYIFEVSKRIKEEFDDGEYYNAFHGQRVHIPANPQWRAGHEFLKWHNENVYWG